MENFTLDQDIPVFYVAAASFPDGVMAAHQALHGVLKADGHRRFFGISRPDASGAIEYKAAAEVLPTDDTQALGFPTMVIPKGNYASRILHNFMEDIHGIARIFDEMLDLPTIDPNGFCLEWYLNDTDVRCMAKLKD